MKIFVSWSGERSKAVATILSDWIKCVIQASRPWISTRDIDRGALWFAEIGDQLKETSVGIICLTQENKTRPWILFEAGALAKGLSSNRVCTFLIDLKTTDLEDPLAQFNHTFPTQESVWGLVQTLNASLGQSSLDDRILQQIFETYWPQFEAKFRVAIAANLPKEKPEPRSEENLLGEILENTRFLSTRLRNLEAQIEDRETQIRHVRPPPMPFMSREDHGRPPMPSMSRRDISDNIRSAIKLGVPNDVIARQFELSEFPNGYIDQLINVERVKLGIEKPV